LPFEWSGDRALGQPSLYAPDVVQLDEQLTSRLTAEFAERVTAEAGLPPARKNGVRQSCEITRYGQLLRLTCTITGSSYERTWDGTKAEASALVDEAAEDTAYLVTRTPHYAWLRSRH
jgi:hypothetical protein